MEDDQTVMEMEEQELQREERRQKAETRKYLAWLDKYRTIHPLPEKPTSRLRETLSLMFWIEIAISLAAIALAANRTAFFFYVIEAKASLKFLGEENVLFSVISAIFAVVAVDGALVLIGLNVGEKHRQMTYGAVLKITLFAVSITAGLGQAVELIPGIETVKFGLTIILSLTTGIGASIIAYFLGENLGVRVAEAKILLEKMKEEYDEKVSEWNARAISSYNSSMARRQKKEPTQQPRPVQQPQSKDDIEDASRTVRLWLDSVGASLLDDLGKGKKYSIPYVSSQTGVKEGTIRAMIFRERKRASQ